MTFEQFLAYIKRTAKMHGKQFTEPDDDWPMLVVVEHDGERPHVMEVPSLIVNSDSAKDALAWGLGEAAKLTRPTKVGIVSSTWMVMDQSAMKKKADGEFDVDDPLDGLRPSQHPARIEAVFVAIADREVQSGAWAQIHRHRKRPPTLGDWEDLGNRGGISGRLFDPIIEALR